MKKIFQKFRMVITVVIVLIVLSSCKDYLDIPMPTNSVSTATAFNGQGTIDGMMYNLYYSFSSNIAAGTDMVRQSEAFADNVYNPTTNQTILDQQNHTVTPATASTCIISWTNAYRTIFLANTMMEGLKDVKTTVLPEANKNAYLGAAKTIRAWTYFMLVRIFGDVPLLTTSSVDDNKEKGRDPKADVYKLIEEDLKDAMSKLPSTTGARYFINNKYIPESMLADLYLNQGKWAEAEAAATDVIASGKYQLMPNLDDVFLQTSKEAIFAPGYNTYWNDNAPKAAPVGLLVWPDNSVSYETIFPALSPDLQNSFEAGDLRWTTWVKLSNTGKYTNPTNRMFCYKFKYNIVVNTSTVIPAGKEQDQSLKRLAEMYLIRAEARAKQNNLTGAAADLNLIRTRAGLTNTTATSQNDLVEAVIKERRIELCFENASRWFDLVRTGKADAVLSILPYKKDNWKPYKVLFPIYQNILNANTKLTQNPGY
jgi:starch-binding outer membrane protein, SusD/RagB family